MAYARPAARWPSLSCSEARRPAAPRAASGAAQTHGHGHSTGADDARATRTRGGPGIGGVPPTPSPRPRGTRSSPTPRARRASTSPAWEGWACTTSTALVGDPADRPRQPEAVVYGRPRTVGCSLPPLSTSSRRWDANHAAPPSLFGHEFMRPTRRTGSACRRSTPARLGLGPEPDGHVRYVEPRRRLPLTRRRRCRLSSAGDDADEDHQHRDAKQRCRASSSRGDLPRR